MATASVAPVGRRHREQLLGEIVRGYYGWLNNHEPFRRALRELFAVRYLALVTDVSRDGPHRGLPSRAAHEFIRRWRLPHRYGARDLDRSFAYWNWAPALRPRLLHVVRYPGLPEHEGGAAATDAHAIRVGYLGRVPPAFLDDERPAADVIAARLFFRTTYLMTWAEIASSREGRGSVDTVRKQVYHWAQELEISLPEITSPGRPLLEDW